MQKDDEKLQNKVSIMEKEEEKHGDDGLRKLVEKNIKWTQVVYEQNRQIKRRLTIMAVGSYLRLFIIVVPIILAIIYLPPIFKQVFQQYSELLGGIGAVKGGSAGLNQIPFDKILGNLSQGQIQELLEVLGRQ